MSVSIQVTRRSPPHLTGTLAEVRRPFAVPLARAEQQNDFRVDLLHPDARADRSLLRAGTPVSYARGKLLYFEQDPAEYVYVVESGLTGTYKVSNDGHRQIVAFFCAGDLFGFEFGERHTLSAEAITGVTVRPLRRASILKGAAQNPRLAHELLNALAREQCRDQAHILRLGKPACQRVASFLLEMDDRLPQSGNVGLPISRQDIADHLGLTIETVSRSLTLIKGTGAIVMSSSRKITIRNLQMLKQLSAQVD